MRCHGVKAGPEKYSASASSPTSNSRHSACQIASWPSIASGMSMPCSAIQSISRCQRGQSQNGVV